MGQMLGCVTVRLPFPANRTYGIIGGITKTAMETFPREFLRLEWEIQQNLDEAVKRGDQEKVRNLLEAITEIHAQREELEQR